MNALTEFSFESHQVRVVTGEDGEPWFNAGDVCGILEFGNPRQAIESHVDSEDVQKLDTPTAGGVQRLNHINESGLYSLIFGSTKDAAKRFKRWVTSEVLPSIRKTGRYESPAARNPSMNDTVQSMLSVYREVARFPGVKPGIAMALTLSNIERHAGIPVSNLSTALPPAEEKPAALNATALGKLAGISARVMNAELAAWGFQSRNARGEWELTKAGEKWGEAFPYSNGKHSGYQILWKPEVLEVGTAIKDPLF